ncbi:hypothetical protein GQ43DRAFT_441636 [Delitschia confertaspora ATCC 74209]|uniref:Uncharacterized protein n=1 Tax=Delitschia confertaspora ATCC 74209 TaxID=1513339 RepID=A0A9P4JNY8_9PLEO|nr:hypothetical protein GQ43DRAFT_441636 [Delitschia confertaspora ATCC 74209]
MKQYESENDSASQSENDSSSQSENDSANQFAKDSPSLTKMDSVKQQRCWSMLCAPTLAFETALANMKLLHSYIG